MSQWIQVEMPDGNITSVPLRPGMTPEQIAEEAARHLSYEGAWTGVKNDAGTELKGGAKTQPITGLKDGDNIKVLAPVDWKPPSDGTKVGG